MTESKPVRRKPRPVVKFFGRLFRVPPYELQRIGEPPPGVTPKMSAVVQLKNQPEFWADAPWRVEPDQDAIPFSFHVRDANIRPPGKGPWRLDLLLVEQRLRDGDWLKLLTLLPSELPGVDDQGSSQSDFWVVGRTIPLAHLQGVRRGDRVRLRARFVGRFAGDLAGSSDRPLEVFLAEHPLPLGRAAHGAGPRHWFWGDTHYHSAYTNDVKEFGGAVPEARKAGLAIGLDWLIVTDHSCDLDEVDGPAGSSRRWERLKADLTSPQLSDDEFRFILGEEITLLGKSGKPLHMLAFGALDDMVEGAFLPRPSDNLEIELVRRALERLLKAAGGYPGDIPARLFGKNYRLEEVLARLPPATLTFAAHPFDVAQVPPGRWTQDDLGRGRLTGYEFWNGRIRASAGRTDNPFEADGWNDPARRRQADDARIERFKKQAWDRWDPQLQRGVDQWPAGDPLPAWRPVFIGGSDAHGDFNYHVGWGWDYQSFDSNDGAFARVRTAVYLPQHAASDVPGVEPILEALRKGSCVVSDGPIVEFWLEQGTRRAHLGETLTVEGSAPVGATVVAHTTPEFGPVSAVEVVSYGTGGQPRRTLVPAGSPQTVGLDAAQGYLRLEARTQAPNGESFYCFTNPIWLRAAVGRVDRVQVSFG